MFYFLSYSLDTICIPDAFKRRKNNPSFFFYFESFYWQWLLPNVFPFLFLELSSNEIRHIWPFCPRGRLLPMELTSSSSGVSGRAVTSLPFSGSFPTAPLITLVSLSWSWRPLDDDTAIKAPTSTTWLRTRNANWIVKSLHGSPLFPTPAPALLTPSPLTITLSSSNWWVLTFALLCREPFYLPCSFHGSSVVFLR